MYDKLQNLVSRKEKMNRKPKGNIIAWLKNYS